jgi:hypothetical protein
MHPFAPKVRGPKTWRSRHGEHRNPFSFRESKSVCQTWGLVAILSQIIACTLLITKQKLFPPLCSSMPFCSRCWLFLVILSLGYRWHKLCLAATVCFALKCSVFLFSYEHTCINVTLLLVGSIFITAFHSTVINTLKPSGNYRTQLSEQSVTLYFCSYDFLWF